MDDKYLEQFNETMYELMHETYNNCKILYADEHPAWECRPGWFDIISSLSYNIEACNQIFKKMFRVYVSADQIKEKFGDLRFYYSVVRSNYLHIEWLCNILNYISNYIHNNLKFNMISVTVKPAKDTMICKEIGLDFDEKNYKYLNSKILKTPENDFACEIKKIHSYTETKRVPTRNILLWKLANICSKYSLKISLIYDIDTNKQRIGRQCLDNIIQDMVHKAELKCYSTCERCGKTIGTDYSPRCETLGWITYICEKCAVGHRHKKNGLLYDEKGNVITK